VFEEIKHFLVEKFSVIQGTLGIKLINLGDFTGRMQMCNSGTHYEKKVMIRHSLHPLLGILQNNASISLLIRCQI